MADTATITVLKNDRSELVLHLTGICDGTGESLAIKGDKSAYTVSGVEPTSLSIQSIRWASQGYSSLRLIWDHTTDITAMVLNGNGIEDFRPFGGKQDSGTGGTGDLCLTTVGGASGSTYDITLELRKE
jgi:hypothetical protein